MCEKHTTSKRLEWNNLSCGKTAPFTEAPSLISPMIVLEPKLYFTAKQDINFWASSFPFNAFASTSSRINRCVGIKSSLKKTNDISKSLTYSGSSTGNVEPLGCSRMSHLLRHSIIIMDWVCFFVFRDSINSVYMLAWLYMLIDWALL